MPVTIPALGRRRRRTGRRRRAGSARGTAEPGSSRRSIRSRTGQLAALAMARDRAVVAAGAAPGDAAPGARAGRRRGPPSRRGWPGSRRSPGRVGCAGRACPDHRSRSATDRRRPRHPVPMLSDRIASLAVIFAFSIGLGVATVAIPLLALESGYDAAAVGFLVATSAASQLGFRLCLPWLLRRVPDRSLDRSGEPADARRLLDAARIDRRRGLRRRPALPGRRAGDLLDEQPDARDPRLRAVRSIGWSR